MRNHSFLYVVLPGGEEGEFQIIAESNSALPSLWEILFAESSVAGPEVQAVLATASRHTIATAAPSAIGRLEQAVSHLQQLAVMHSVPGLNAYLRASVEHLKEVVAAWSPEEGLVPSFAATFDELHTPDGISKEEFIGLKLAEFPQRWPLLVDALAANDLVAIEDLLRFSSARLSASDWKSWAGVFGLALFVHPYFYDAFRKPHAMAYADYAYDPLGSEDELGAGLARFKQEDKWGVRFQGDGKDVTLLAAKWDRVLRAQQGDCQYVWIQRDRRFGLAAVSGQSEARVLLAPSLDEVWPFHEGLALVRVGTKMGYLRIDGVWHLQPQWDDAWEFENGFAVVVIDHRFTYIDRNGVALVAPQFDEAHPFSAAGVAKVRRGALFGLLGYNGEMVLPLQYDNLQWREDIEGWIGFSNGQQILFRANGESWIDGHWNEIELARPRMFLTASRIGRIALLDWNGQVLFEREGEELRLRYLADPSSLAPISEQHQTCAQFFVTKAGQSMLVNEHGEDLVSSEAFSQVEELEAHREGTSVLQQSDLIRVYSREQQRKPRAGVWDVRRQVILVPCRYDIVWLVMFASADDFGFFVATKTHFDTGAKDVTYRVGLLRSDGTPLIPEAYAWIGDRISLGRANALKRVRSAIYFAVATGRSIEAARSEDGALVELRIDGTTIPR